jgi:hypothetical protein
MVAIIAIPFALPVASTVILALALEIASIVARLGQD